MTKKTTAKKTTADLSPDVDLFGERLAARAGTLGGATLRVLRFIDRNRVVALAGSAAELAARTHTSDATVIRAVQTLGFTGLPELRQALSAELQGRAPIAEGMRRTLRELGESVERAVQFGLDTHRDGVAALRAAETRAKIVEAVAVLHPAERIVLFGIGPSAPLAQYTALLLRRGGRHAEVLDRTGSELADQLLDLRPTDALLVLAYGEPYREVIAVFDEAEPLGIPVVLITNTLDSRLTARARIVVPVPRGITGGVALHGTTLICLEAFVLGLAASAEELAVTTLERLSELRQAVTGRREQ